MACAKTLFLSPFVVILIVGALSGCGSGGGTEGGGGTGGGSTPTPMLTVSVNPASPAVTPGDSFFVTVYAITTGTTATPTVSLGTLPAGLTTTSTFPMTVPTLGARINFATSGTIAAGTITVPVSAAAGTVTATASIPIQVVNSAPGPLGVSLSPLNEVQLVQGTSASLHGSVSTPANSPIYAAALSVTGLPSGVTATINPQVVEADDAFTVTLAASSTAQVVNNQEWSIVATPVVNVNPSSSTYLLDVSPGGGGVGWSNQTSFVSTRATPFSAVYDPAHQMIYAANNVWNRIDVISDKTRAIVRSISIRDPRAVDLSIDGSTVWVATGGQVVYGIDTGTFQAARYVLPRYGVTSTSAGTSWEGGQVFSLADGTVLLVFGTIAGTGITGAAIWSPATNELTPFQPPSSVSIHDGVIARSGDGKKLFSAGGDEDETSYTYDVLTKTFSTPVPLSSYGYADLVAANYDGSRVAVSTSGRMPFAVYDGNFNFLAQLPGDGGVAGAGVYPPMNLLSGGTVFSPDGKTLYEETESTAIPLIVSFDVATLEPTALAPAMPVNPDLMLPPFFLPDPFAVDANGMLLGIQYEGIAFDDATVNMNYSILDPGTPPYPQNLSVYSGPLSGGTTSSVIGNTTVLPPDVYYGAIKGPATLSGGQLSITSPPAASPGPVDLKMLSADGIEIYHPQFFTYGTKLNDAIISGAGPQGGAAATLDAFGLPLDPSQDTVTIGGNSGTVTSTVTQYPPFTGEQTAMYLSYSVPPGSPGWTDLTVKTPNGSSTLPKAFFYAKSVTDYSTSDSPTFVLYDKARNQLYLSAGNHIDVFSISSNSFVSSLQPPSLGANKQFEGLALTPDGKNLLAANLADNSLAVINPDNPSVAFAVAVATGGPSPGYSCPTGPLFVAADNLGNAYVVTGGVIGIACGPGGYDATVNLTTKTSALMKAPGCEAFAGYVDSTAGGSLIALTGGGGYGNLQLYVPATGSCIPAAAPAQPDGLAVSADGNVIGVVQAFVDPSGTVVGRFAYPHIYYPGNPTIGYTAYQGGALQNPELNEAGSLYYWAYPNYVDIIDVQHGTPALRFGLTETVSNTVAPIAIDSSGQRIFLITNKGLTIVDLGNPPLSVGHLSQPSAAAGSQIQVRGSGFENGITATVGGISASLVFTDSETLTLTIPSTSAGPQDIVLSNPNGTSYTLQHAISVQ